MQIYFTVWAHMFDSWATHISSNRWPPMCFFCASVGRWSRTATTTCRSRSCARFVYTSNGSRECAHNCCCIAGAKLLTHKLTTRHNNDTGITDARGCGKRPDSTEFARFVSNAVWTISLNAEGNCVLRATITNMVGLCSCYLPGGVYLETLLACE